MFKTLLFPALVRRCLILLLLSTAGWLATVPSAQAQRRPTKRIPAAASPSADTTSGGASAAPKKAAAVPANKATKPAPAVRPTSPASTYRVRGLNSRTSRKLRLRPDGTPDFVDINRYPYFEDKKALRAIAKAERRRQYHQTRVLLESYVARFGPTNFASNTDMLWRLGQLLERDSQTVKAKAYYRLALKHSRSDIKRIQLYYDSLEQKNQAL